MLILTVGLLVGRLPRLEALQFHKGDIRTVPVGGDVLAITAAFPEQRNTKVIVYDYCKSVVVSSIEANN